MIFFSAYLREDQMQFIRKLSGSNSEHVRRAIDDYIKKLTPANASLSLSKQKGEDDGSQS